MSATERVKFLFSVVKHFTINRSLYIVLVSLLGGNFLPLEAM